ncbi:MAG: hypothetical protein NT141_02710 [candidate division WWE3 bacterium]|nr:hypothetical protein [candidate division WWE3 bacterium]
MTICIAAIAENKKILAITDKMITMGGGVATRYEISENNKAIQLTNKSIGLFSGNVLSANEILSVAREKIKSNSNSSTLSVLDVAELIKSSYFEYWATMLNNQVFCRYALTLETFMQNQKNLNDDLVKEINNILANTNVGVDILVAGVDSAPHLYLIQNPGTLNSFDSIGYALIGSGSQHAQLSLIENEYNACISEKNGIYALLEAKKRAEYDPGVGQLCDLVIIGNTFNKVTPEKTSKIVHEFSESSVELKRIKEEKATNIFNLVYAS